MQGSTTPSPGVTTYKSLLKDTKDILDRVIVGGVVCLAKDARFHGGIQESVKDEVVDNDIHMLGSRPRRHQTWSPSWTKGEGIERFRQWKNLTQEPTRKKAKRRLTLWSKNCGRDLKGTMHQSGGVSSQRQSRF